MTVRELLPGRYFIHNECLYIKLEHPIWPDENMVDNEVHDQVWLNCVRVRDGKLDHVPWERTVQELPPK